MIRRIHNIILLLALLVGCAGMNYVQAANVTLTVTASPAAGGQVRIANGSWTTSTNGTTSRSVAQSTPISISAQAASGYTFSQWNDGNKNATRAVQITKNTTYTATFIPNTVTLTVTSNNTNYGTVTGGGTYSYGTSVTIKATPKAGYHFVQWSDGNKNASRTVTATANASYQATFAINQYTLTLKTATGNTTQGTVRFGGETAGASASQTFTYYDGVNIIATPATGYHFVKWSDNNTNANRVVYVTAAATYTATFAVNTYTLTVKTATNNTTQGTVKINSGTAGASASATINHGVAATITATPATGYHFVKWNDNNTNASRSVTVTAAATYTATFAINTYTIKFVNGSTTLQTSTVNHGVTPTYSGSTPTKSATVQYTYAFSGWSPTIAAATKDQTYTAQFSQTTRSYKITGASANTAMGTVSGTATKQYNQTVTLTATPKSCYQFVQWNDGNTSNPRTVTVQGTATYTATFEETINGTCGANGDNVKWYFNECTGALRIVGTGAMFAYSSFSAVPWYAYRASITSVTIANGVTSIGGCAFNCANLTTVTIPPSITSIGGNAFYGCNAMESLYITDLAAWCNINFGTEYSSPFCRNIYSSNKGGGNLYVNNTKVTTLTIPNGITSIPAFAFGGWAGTSIQFNQATNINLRAFNGCQGLTSVTIPEGVTKIGNDAFAYCANLQSITIPASVTSMGSEVLYNCSSLTDIYVSWTANVPSWPSNFTNKSPQSSITLHVPCGSGDLYRAANGWKDYTMQGSGTSNYTLTVKANNSAMGTVKIDDDAAGATVSKSIHCEDTHTITATSTGCHHFTQWNDGNTENPRKIGISSNKTYTATFAEGLGSGTCGTDLTWYLNCDGVLTISGTSAMNNYSSTTMPWYTRRNDVKQVFINPGVTNIGQYAFYNCINLTSVSIPSSVTTIKPYAFQGCSSLSSVTIPSGVTTINYYAFRNCTSLTSVTIPSSVTSLGDETFYNTGLTDVYVSWTTAEAIPEWYSMVETNQAKNITLHVPCGTAEYYLAKAGWNNCNIRGGCNTTYTLTVASGNTAFGLVQIDKGTPDASITEQVYTDDSHYITALPIDACHHFVQWDDGNTDNPRNVMPNTNTTYTATFEEHQYSGTCGIHLTWVLECDSTLRISGTGEMSDYSTSPWNSLKNIIKHVVIEEGVTTIGNNAFYGMDIVTVTNPSTLKTIGSTAFYNCYQLESINFPHGMTSIGRNTTGHGPFYGCHSLKSIYIPASVTMINKDAFLRCFSLTSIVVDPANPKYDSRDNCNAIIETATNKLLYGCQTTVIPDGVLTVSQYAFEYQHNLKSIRISNTVTHFETSVFKECENLKDIYVEWTTTPPQDILTSWQEHTNLDATITIHVPCGYKSLYSSSSAWNRYQIVDDHLKGGMCGAQGSNQTWMLSCDGHLDIKGIGAMADYSAGGAPWNEHKDAIHTVTFSDGINTIGKNAFAGFTNLTDIYAPWTENIPVLPSSNNPQSSVSLHVPCIATGAYQTADGWKDYTITPEYTASGTCGADGDNLTWTLCDDGTLTISGTGAMAGWENIADIPWYSYQESITSVIIEEGVTNIGKGAFYKISSLLSVTIPSSVTSIDYCAFYECTSLVSVTIQEGLISLDASAFNGCSALTSAPIPNSVTSIGNSAFKNCSSLSSLTIPNGVETIGSSAFESCSGLTSVTIPNNVTRINEQAFRYCSSLTEVTIPGSVTRLSSFAFANCSALTSVVISEGVEIIDMAAFQKCSHLTTVTFPSSVTDIYVHSFTFCSAITDIYVSWTENIPYWNNITNRSPQSGITLHIPCGTEELYNAASGWNGYTIVDEIVASGTCGADGDNLTWTLCDGTLTISGTGAMANYPAMNMPWKDYRTSITSVIISEGVTTIGAHAFNGCSHMTSLTVPASLTTVGQNAFTSCWAMESVYISDLEAWCNIDFGTYDSSPFSRNGYSNYVGGGDLYVNDTKVTTLTIPDGIMEIKHDAFYGFAGITDIEFNQVTTIGNSAFDGCHGLTEVTIPEGVTAIGQYGFAYCSHLQSISIPASASSLGTSMLAANNMLTDIHVQWTENIPAWPDNFTKKNPQSSITLHIPCAAIELYQDADGWKDYTIEGEGGPFTITVTTDDASMGSVAITVP